ncbi:MAG: AAA family ATPase, partial [Sphingomonadaceae bacterium]
LIYIEEPEAHLFPSAQSMLLDFLISSTSTNSRNRQLIMTTHSPYIMGKLNVFLKAGQLSKRRKINKKINEVVPRDCWLTSNDLSAYSISNGELDTSKNRAILRGYCFCVV